MLKVLADELLYPLLVHCYSVKIENDRYKARHSLHANYSIIGESYQALTRSSFCLHQALKVFKISCEKSAQNSIYDIFLAFEVPVQCAFAQPRLFYDVIHAGVLEALSYKDLCGCI